jgi:hypothetical protein
MNVQINSIIPATGWAAIYKDPNEKDSKIAIPLVCWALGMVTSESGEYLESGVFGMVSVDGNTVPAKERTGFLDYDYDTDGALFDYESLNG